MESQKQELLSQNRQVDIDSASIIKAIHGSKEIGVKTVLFIGGEPLLRKDLFNLIDYTNRQKMTPIIVTNGVLLTRSMILKCFEHEVKWISISIDAATDVSFSKIRGEKVFDRIIKNLKTLQELKDKNGLDFPKTVAMCTIMDENADELLEIVNLCRRLGFHQVLFQPVVPVNIDQAKKNKRSLISSDRLHVIEESIDKLIAFKKKSKENFDYVGNGIKQLKDIKKYFKGDIGSIHQNCYVGYNRIQVVQEGKLYFCVNQDIDVATFGNIKKDQIKKLWFSKEAKNYRKKIRNCKTPCLQWCSYRDQFYYMQGFFDKLRLSDINHKNN